MRTGLLIAAGLLVAALSAYAQQPDDRTGGQKQEQSQEQQEKKSSLYQWTDDKGVTHITDELGKVPKKYRDKALRLESPTEGGAAQGQTEKAAPSDTREGQREAAQKAYWQQRMKAAKQRLADAEQRYRELEQKRNELLGKWGGVASGRLQEREEAERITQEMQQVQHEIDDARDQVENVIPDEARRAGAEPGWLRE